MAIDCKSGSSDQPLWWPTGVIVFAAIVVCLLVAAAGSDLNRDESIWSYIGWVWDQHGQVPYRDTFDNKTPGIFIVYALTNHFSSDPKWPARLAGILFIAGTSLLIYRLGCNLHGRRAGLYAMLLFGLASAWGAMSGDSTAHTESFMAFFTTLSFLLILGSPAVARSPLGMTSVFLSGMAMGMAISFKEIAVTDAAALMVVCLLRTGSDGAGIARSATAIALLLGGMLAANVASFIPLAAGGVTVEQYWTGAWVILRQSPAPSPVSRLMAFYHLWTNPKVMLFYPLLAAFILQPGRIKAVGTPLGAMLIWLTMAFIGANASGHLYGHQLKQSLPPLALCGAIGLAAAIKAIVESGAVTGRVTGYVLGFCAILWAPYDTFYRGFLKLALPTFAAKEQAGNPSRFAQAGDWLAKNSSASDYVYIYSSDSGIVHMVCRRLSPSGFFHDMFFSSKMPSAVESLAADLAARPPRYILLDNQDSQPLPEVLTELERKQYHFVTDVGDFKVFERTR